MNFDRLLRGEISRARFFYIGFALFLLKYNLDRIIAAFHGQSWGIFTYWEPDPILSSLAAAAQNGAMFRWLAITAVPFMVAGVLLTVARLRDAGAPRVLALMFFVPYINLLFFALLSALPGRHDLRPPGAAESYLSRVMPRSAAGAIAAGLLTSVAIALACVYLSVNVLRGYGWGLFLGIPFIAGFCASGILNFHRDTGVAKSLVVSTTALVVTGAFLFGLAMEGLICILMAVPLALPLGWLGAMVAHALQRTRFPRRQPGTAMSALLLLLPGLLGWENAHPGKAELIAVRTEITIAATSEQVWNHVVTFSRLPEPDEWLFKTGIAFPQQATIVGSGPGAVRYCTFSTGSFVEPITVWDAPRRLAFDVAAQPPVMHEFGITDDVVPAHISGHYLQSERGEFWLEPLGQGTTRLVGTTWYRLRFWPTRYWQTWSDAVIHRIHLRVLRHVKHLSESDTGQ